MDVTWLWSKPIMPLLTVILLHHEIHIHNSYQIKPKRPLSKTSREPADSSVKSTIKKKHMGMIKNGFGIILIHMTLKRSQYLAHLAFILFFHWTHLFFSFKMRGKLFKTAMLLCELFTLAHKQAQARETTAPKHGCPSETRQGEICGVNKLCDCRTSFTLKHFSTVYSMIAFPPCSLKRTLQLVAPLYSSI